MHVNVEFKNLNWPKANQSVMTKCSQGVELEQSRTNPVSCRVKDFNLEPSALITRAHKINAVISVSRDVCFPKEIHTQHTPSSIRLQEFCVSFHVIFHLKRTPDILYCTVLFFFPPTLPPSVILRDVIGWQRGLLSTSLAVVYFSFVFLINFSLCRKAICVLFVSGSVVGE